MTSSRIQESSLTHEIRQRYLSYALSVITARALPDVRDGLKPVQRRILYAMFHQLHLSYGARFRKSAAVVGEVLGKFHPHGDQAVYEAMARMAQNWVLRYPLVQGYGNFGSLDGDPPAAMRYTEVRLSALADELFADIKNQTVDFRPNYDGTGTEPVVFPVSFPLLLVNGCSGIAVGMATNIPPHNLGEVIQALLLLIKQPDCDTLDLMHVLPGPDFPTGGIILNSKAQLRQIYKTGQGSIKMRGKYTIEELPRGRRQIVITAVPYMVDKGSLIEKIGELIAGRKVPQLVDIRDESTEQVRIVLELKNQADPHLAMAYLFKHTALQHTFNVNFNVLVPLENGTYRPQVLDLKTYLEHFLAFREAVIRRRLTYHQEQTQQRLEHLQVLRKAKRHARKILDILLKAPNRDQATQAIMELVKVSQEQVAIILDTRLYRLSRPEGEKIESELQACQKELHRLQGLLKSRRRLLALMVRELESVARQYSDTRRSSFEEQQEIPAFDPEAYIEHEDAYVIVTVNGWTKRQGSIKDLQALRIRDSDQLLTVVYGNTKSLVAFFSNYGTAYVRRIHDIPATTGYGESIHKMYKLTDGEKIIAAFSLDTRCDLPRSGEPASVHLLTITRRGYGFRFSLASYTDPSSKSGRRFAKLGPQDEVIALLPVKGHEILVTASHQGRVLLCHVAEISILSSAGRGVIVHKIAAEDHLVGAGLCPTRQDGVDVQTGQGRVETIRPAKYKVAHRAGKGLEFIRRGVLVRVVPPPISMPALLPAQSPTTASACAPAAASAPAPTTAAASGHQSAKGSRASTSSASPSAAHPSQKKSCSDSEQHPTPVPAPPSQEEFNDLPLFQLPDE